MQVQWIVYALVFITILLLVEGVFLFMTGTSARDAAVNRRMEVVKRTDTTSIAPSLLRNKVIGGALSQWLLKATPNLERAFWAANLSITPVRAAIMCITVFAVLMIGLSVWGFFPLIMQLVIAAGVAFGLPLLVLNIAVDRQKQKFADQLSDAINLITRGLQAGHPIPVALGLVARELPDPIGSQFGTALDEMNFGRDRAVALREIGLRFPVPEFLFFVAAMEMQRKSGGNLVGVLDNLVKTMRERANLEKKAFAVSAEGRLTAVIVGSMPYLLLIFFLLTNPGFILDQVENPMFWPLMMGAWVMWLIGMIMIWRMVNIKV
jgi:tight adherence protein B